MQSCRRSTTWGMTPACCSSRRSDASRWCWLEKGRSGPAAAASSRRAARMRSRRHSAVISPSMAEAATPATEVPNASPRPRTGADSASRMASSPSAPASAAPVPFRATTMPPKVPSMPSSTSRPLRYEASTGPGRPARAPSTRWRTASRNAAGSVASQSSSRAGVCESAPSAPASASVAREKRSSSQLPSR